MCSDVNTKGRIPGPEYLVQLCRSENASISWLLDGIGAPFIVTAHASDIEAADALQARLGDEPNIDGLILCQGSRLAVVLHQEVEHDFRGNAVRYTEVDIHAGRIGAKALEVLESQGACSGYPVTADFMDRVITGQVGTYLLFDAPNAPLSANQVAESGAPYHVDFEAAVGLQDDIERLTPDQQQAIQVMIQSFRH